MTRKQGKMATVIPRKKIFAFWTIAIGVVAAIRRSSVVRYYAFKL